MSLSDHIDFILLTGSVDPVAKIRGSEPECQKYKCSWYKPPGPDALLVWQYSPQFNITGTVSVAWKVNAKHKYAWQFFFGGGAPMLVTSSLHIFGSVFRTLLDRRSWCWRYKFCNTRWDLPGCDFESEKSNVLILRSRHFTVCVCVRAWVGAVSEFILYSRVGTGSENCTRNPTHLPDPTRPSCSETCIL